ncbi:SxtJ family membrane protein [Chelativorans xinjiangense]|uniref:SxtJ family membrane protein n=1 Tax=Chelativorans xinjiangense TaxID=2681485 RepID=UPI00135A44F5|nr:SxtJ family membrane protein [Chelativorans xinjiangense]
MVAPHETLIEKKLEGPSNRSFGLTVGGILLVFVVARLWLVGHFTVTTASLAAIGAVLVLLAAVAPAVLDRPNRLWTALGVLLFRFANPVIMLVIYTTTFVPIGIVLRVRGHDPLARRAGRTRESYWISRTRLKADAETMRHQF